MINPGVMEELVAETESQRMVPIAKSTETNGESPNAISISSLQELSSLPATTKIINVDKWKRSFPARFIFELIYWIHYKGTNHAGRDVLIVEATNYGEYWRLRSIATWIASHCEDCKAEKPTQKTATKITRRTNYDPGWFHVDLTFCNAEIILMFICRMDRVLYSKVLENKTAACAKEALKELIDAYSLHLTTIFSDNGKEFAGEFKEYLEEIEKTLALEGKEFHKFQSLPVSPHMNGMIENVNRIKKTLRPWFSKNPLYFKEQLIDKVAEITWLYNNQNHSIVGMSPLQFKKSTID